MAQSITAIISSLSVMPEDDKDAELLWLTQVIKTIKDLKDNPSTDCNIIVGETRIPVHKAVIQLNSSLLISRSNGFDGQNEVTEIEVEPEVDVQPDLVKKIITSFYSGTIEIDEGSLKEVYKFSTIYEIGWLRIHTGRLIVNYLTKSIYGCYDRFTEIFSFAHFIWDTELLESCIQVMDEGILESLLNDEDMLGKISYRCMEIITISSNVGFPEKDLFNLIVNWVTCKKQKCNLNIFQKLFENLRYESISDSFIIECVMTFVFQNEGIFSVSFLKKLQDGLTENDSSKDIILYSCRSEKMKENALKRVQILLDNLQSSDKRTKERVNEVNSFLIRKDIRYLSEEMKETLTFTIWGEALDFYSKLDLLAVVNLVNHYQTESTGDILKVNTFSRRQRKLSVFNKLDWTTLTDKAIICVLDNSRFSIGPDEIALSWCLANRGTCDDATLERITSKICYKKFDDVYRTHILLPTIKHLFPDITELKCHHSAKCVAPWTNYEIQIANGKLYRLEAFEDDVATLSDNNGVLQLTFNGKTGSMFIKNKPYEPFFPTVYCKEVDDETLRYFIATLEVSDEIAIIKHTINDSSEHNIVRIQRMIPHYLVE